MSFASTYKKYLIIIWVIKYKAIFFLVCFMILKTNLEDIRKVIGINLNFN